MSEHKFNIWYDEITKLSPEIQQRDQIRTILDELRKGSDQYFATIPKDICDIIFQMIPDLRVSWHDSKHPCGYSQEFSEFLTKSRESLNNFINTYRNDHVVQPLGIDLTIVDGKKLNSDFPQTVGAEHGGMIGVKFIAGQPRFALHREWVTKVYIGDQFDHMQMPNNCTDDPSIAPKYCENADEKYNLFLQRVINKWFQAKPIHILPCGLILMYVEQRSGPHAFIINPRTLECSDKIRYCRERDTVMDDFGVVTKLSKDDSEILAWTNICPDMLRLTFCR